MIPKHGIRRRNAGRSDGEAQTKNRTLLRGCSTAVIVKAECIIILEWMRTDMTHRIVMPVVSIQSTLRNAPLHYIKTSVARDLILGAIRDVSQYVLSDEERFINEYRESNELKHAENVKIRAKQLALGQRRYDELNLIIKKLFEEKVTGAITDKRFEILSHDYEVEQENLENQIAELQAGLEEYQSDSVKAEQFIKVVKKYTDLTELSPAMLNEFIEKVVVYESEKVNGRVRKQKVEIFLNFIGMFNLPNQAEPEEEIDPVEKQRAKWREYYYKDREKILARLAKKRTESKAKETA